ncbi:unnamed protein product [Hyaloperonospora brassicae]|uniref:Protein kinase domain-containing protein n=1 Tax=Hyaloperonospora brassicae TaxID=162125 RepID=A0AAV0UFT5_HYABA|nr:unnamed protein product [Hyaloperonospora brassicae]
MTGAASSDADESSTMDSKWVLVALSVAAVGLLTVGCCYCVEYVNCDLTPELLAIVADSAHRSSSATRFGTRLFYYLPGISSVPSMDVFDQFSRPPDARKSTSAATTATATASPALGIDDDDDDDDDGLQLSRDRRDELELHARVLEQCRLPPESVEGGELLHEGSFALAFRATLQLDGQPRRSVIVRRLLPELVDQQTYRRAFVADIALCAALVHPRIVAFVGVFGPTQRAYDLDASSCSSVLSLQEAQLSAVTEYMANGTLRALLTLRGRNSPDFGWFQSSVSMLKPKAQLALDIVDALVYLHSRPAGPTAALHPPELKAQRVLLSEHCDAKLCAFGLRRAVGVQAAFSRSDFSVAWLAPELLRGEPRSEQADVYSLGVLLTELDTGKLPFEAGVDMDDGMDEQRQLALLVSSGSIRPALSMDCPVQIQELVLRCLSFSPPQRPPAVEVQHTLRKLINGTSVCTLSQASLVSDMSVLDGTSGPSATALSALFTS